jgi:predicted TIM-barrel fold metal-dependent hydrolase
VTRSATLLTTFLAFLLCLVPAARAADSAAAPDAAAARAQLLRGYAAEIRRIRAAGQTPIIDVEHHWGGRLPLEALVAKMDRGGVALTWLGQNERNGSVRALGEAARYPARIVPTTIHGDGPRWHGGDPALLDELAADAGTGRYFAMGEFEARHYVSSTNDRDVHKPVDSEGFERVFRIADETGLPMLLHHEAEDALLPELERMLERHPKARVIWCHVGRNRDRKTWTVLPTPEGVHAFLKRFPNLYFDLNQAPPGSTHRGTRQLDSVLYDRVDPNKGGNNQPDAVLDEAWRALFEEFPDRFLFGSDVNTGRWDNYGRVVENFRWLILKRLSPAAGEQIAWRNAWRLMGGGEFAE